MIDAQRVKMRMRELNLSNSELARRVGVTPPAIRDIVTGGAYNSRHLHKIARELGTTPAYLTGETDNLNSDMPDQPKLTREERELIDCFAALKPGDRAALVRVAHSMAGDAPPTLHAPKPRYRAQRQSLLRMI